MTREDEALHSLHCYFTWANRMKIHFYELLPQLASATSDSREAATAHLYMSLWYGELYVVIEGWKELGLTDPSVDALLASPNLQLLRRYRSRTFHFRKHHFDEHFLGFIRDGQYAAEWAFLLNEAFNQFFIKKLTSKKQ